MKNIIGLTDEQVKESKEKYGGNTLTELPSETFMDKLKGNFGDPMIKILCVALALNVIFAFMGYTQWYESVGIAMAVILATFVSTFSEYNNENAFQKLQADASKIICKVYRNGTIVSLPIDEIVVGDSILLQSGDKIPADGILIDGNIKVDQSTLNGESKEALKIVMEKDYVESPTHMDFLNEYKVFSGTIVCAGNAVMCASVVGDKTVYGQIASELQVEEERDSPLKVKLSKLAGDISKFGYIGGITIAVALLFQKIVMQNNFDISKMIAYCTNLPILANDIVEAVILAVIIIVMAVPEGLPLMIAIVSALNMGKMLKDNVLVRKISGIETAGSLNILFSDKTGTITKGLLEAVMFVSGQGNEYKNQSEVVGELNKILSLSIHQNTNAIITNENGQTKLIGGNATERAVLGFVANSIFEHSISTDTSIPFDSARKFSATSISGDYNLTLIKGATENIINKCKFYYDEKGNKVPLTNISVIETKIEEMANRSIRVIGLATCDGKIIDDQLPTGEWTLVGIMGIRDEIRQESVHAIQEVKDAGIQVVMITGDRKETAVAIAREAGIIQNETDIVYTSDELKNMTDEQIKANMKNLRVVSRALPSDKSRLVRLARELNLVVGMTGDGVNDSPALKNADVGFGMGGGTEVAKEASDIVILDDNFSSIENAILFGRTIFNSIRKFIIFQLTINVTAVLVSFVFPLLGVSHVLTITQILWVNLVMDTLAALAFGGEPALRRYMQEKPKSRDEHIVSKYMWSSIFTSSIWIFGISLFFMFTNTGAGLFRKDDANIYLYTGYFAFFIFAAVANAFNARTEKINLFDNIMTNTGFFVIIGIIVVTQVVMTYFGGVVLRCYGLTISEWYVVIALSITVIPIDIIRKAIVGDTKYNLKTNMNILLAIALPLALGGIITYLF